MKPFACLMLTISLTSACFAQLQSSTVDVTVSLSGGAVRGSTREEHGVLLSSVLLIFSVHRRAISETIMSYWVNFAHSGDPNGPGLPRWPIFDGKTVLELGTTVQPVSPAQIDRFRFLETLRTNGAYPVAWRNIPASDPPSPPAPPPTL